jgi:hypothetical protein
MCVVRSLLRKNAFPHTSQTCVLSEVCVFSCRRRFPAQNRVVSTSQRSGACAAAATPLSWSRLAARCLTFERKALAAGLAHERRERGVAGASAAHRHHRQLRGGLQSVAACCDDRTAMQRWVRDAMRLARRGQSDTSSWRTDPTAATPFWPINRVSASTDTPEGGREQCRGSTEKVMRGLRVNTLRGTRPQLARSRKRREMRFWERCCRSGAGNCSSI